MTLVFATLTRFWEDRSLPVAGAEPDIHRGTRRGAAGYEEQCTGTASCLIQMQKWLSALVVYLNWVCSLSLGKWEIWPP